MAKKTDRKAFLNRKSTVQSHEIVEANSISLLNRPSIGLSLDVTMSHDEEVELEKLLKDYCDGKKKTDTSLKEDLLKLKHITTEIKSIAAQSVILHGERIKRAQKILSDYRDGIFTKWLMKTYGNRTTPYSMLHFFNLYHQLNGSLKEKLQLMPKKAAYTLASRVGELVVKEQIVEQFDNQNQKDLIAMIKRSFPVEENSLPIRKKTDRANEIAGDMLSMAKKLFDLKLNLTPKAIKKLKCVIEEIEKSLKN